MIELILRSKLTEQVAGVGSVAGALGVRLAHDALHAGLLARLVSVHVTLQVIDVIYVIGVTGSLTYLHDGDGGNGGIGERVFRAQRAGVAATLGEAHFQSVHQAGEQLDNL